MVDWNKIIRPNILKLEPYRSARDDFKEGLLLDANENPHGPALSSLSEEEQNLELHRYPDPHHEGLKQKIAKFRNGQPSEYLKDASKNLKVENVSLGVGSDESIDMLFRCLCVPSVDKVLVCPPTYGMYSVCAAVNDVGVEEVPLKYPGFQLDAEAVYEKLANDGKIKVLFVTSPGNPTAALIDVSVIVDLLKRLETVWNGIVVVDEAYIDFTISQNDSQSASMATLVNEYPNLVVVQTISKSFGLAGVRLGITFSSPVLAHYINASKHPYNISSITASLATRAIEQGSSTMYNHSDKIRKQRDWLLNELSKIEGIGKNIGGSEANFILIEICDRSGKPSNESAKKLYQSLAADQKVIVRFRGNELNCKGSLRITVGTEDENKTLVQGLASCLQGLNN